MKGVSPINDTFNIAAGKNRDRTPVDQHPLGAVHGEFRCAHRASEDQIDSPIFFLQLVERRVIHAACGADRWASASTPSSGKYDKLSYLPTISAARIARST